MIPSTHDIREKLATLRSQFNLSLDRLEAEIVEHESRFSGAWERRIGALEKDLRELEKRKNTAAVRADKQIKALEARNAKLIQQIGSGPSVDTMPSAILEKARTIAIFDTVLNGITMWSKDGDLANDFEMASQAILFPMVYERVMRADDPAYLLEDIPLSATVVVQHGREMVQWIRSECESAITEPTAWEVYCPQITDWWKNEALPLIYGERDDTWDTDIPYTLDQMFVWKNNPADRMIEFPEVFDAMDLLRKTRSEVVPGTQIPAFNNNIAATRL